MFRKMMNSIVNSQIHMSDNQERDLGWQNIQFGLNKWVSYRFWSQQLKVANGQPQDWVRSHRESVHKDKRRELSTQ